VVLDRRRDRNQRSTPYCCGSSTFHTGIQYTPVGSMATRRTLCCFNQSRNASRPSVKVANVSRSISTSLRPCT